MQPASSSHPDERCASKFRRKTAQNHNTLGLDRQRTDRERRCAVRSPQASMPEHLFGIQPVHSLSLPELVTELPVESQSRLVSPPQLRSKPGARPAAPAAAPSPHGTKLGETRALLRRGETHSPNTGCRRLRCHHPRALPPHPLTRILPPTVHTRSANAQHRLRRTTSC